ncbi:MAG: SPOR domain-containing protein [Gammaproteobacteria bacterium]
MRIVVFVLIGLNVLYLAWAGWVDAPALAPPPPVASTEPLPQLVLAAESLPHPATPSASVDSLPSATAPSVALAQPVTSTSAASAERCVSIGPFNDLAQAARGAALLRSRGFAPKQRAEQGEMWEGYWVSVGGLGTPADETRLMKALDRAGIRDAHVMPDEPGGRRVSVGLFSERERADKRAQAVKMLGFTADVTERTQPGTVYWVDMDVNATERSVPTEGLLSLEDSKSRLEIRVCPVNEPAPDRAAPAPRDARPAATTADAGVPRPG